MQAVLNWIGIIMLSLSTSQLYAVQSYGNPEDPVVAEVLSLQIRTKTPEEMQSVIGQKLLQNYAKQNNIVVMQKDIDLYLTRMDRFESEDRKNNNARRIEIQQQLKDGSLTMPAQKKKQLDLELNTLNSLHQFEIAEEAENEKNKEAVLKVRQDMAKASIAQWMINKALYQQYGGRIIYQQMGPEALDATHDYLKEQQKKGAFTIIDKRFEVPFWEYFINDSKHQFYKQGSTEEKLAFDSPPWRKSLQRR